MDGLLTAVCRLTCNSLLPCKLNHPAGSFFPVLCCFEPRGEFKKVLLVLIPVLQFCPQSPWQQLPRPSGMFPLMRGSLPLST